MKRLFAGISALFVLAASGAMVPDGFHFEKNDHFLTPSESLSFTYRFQDGDDSALREGVDYRVFDLANRALAVVSPALPKSRADWPSTGADAEAGFRAQERLAYA